MPLINHTPSDNRASLYGSPCQEKVMDPRGKITHGLSWYNIGGGLPGDTCKRRYNNPNRFKKRIIETATGRIFESITDAAAELGITYSAMSLRVKKGKGFDYLVKKGRENLKIKNLVNGKIYKDIHEAMEKTGESIDTIRGHCQKQKNLKKYRYEYVEREENED